MKKHTIGAFALALLLSLVYTACSAPTPVHQRPALSFEAQMEVNADQEFHVSLGIHNASTAPFAGDEAFKGQMELRYADGDQTGELRASAEIVALAPLAPGDTAWPMAWRSPLDPGAYVLTWGAEDYGVATARFQIVERDGRLYLGPTLGEVPCTA
jgi:hypothetical protein